MKQPTGRNRTNKSLVFVVLAAAMYLAILGTVGGSLGRVWWPLDVMSNLRFQYLCVLLVVAGPLVWAGYRRHAMLAGAGGLMNLALIIPMYFNAPAAGDGVADLRVLAINVLTSNRDYGEVLSIIEQVDPDVVVLTEVDQSWLDGVAPILQRLPHAGVAPRNDNFGIAIYSRKPLLSAGLLTSPTGPRRWWLRWRRPGKTCGSLARIRCRR